VFQKCEGKNKELTRAPKRNPETIKSSGKSVPPRAYYWVLLYTTTIVKATMEFAPRKIKFFNFH
jgi:hypothetical protein